eukprot:2772755-Rhodomonas_salina.1
MMLRQRARLSGPVKATKPERGLWSAGGSSAGGSGSGAVASGDGDGGKGADDRAIFIGSSAPPGGTRTEGAQRGDGERDGGGHP